jgi:uncharacterized protein YjbI with pentapeptide repeats
MGQSGFAKISVLLLTIALTTLAGIFSGLFGGLFIRIPLSSPEDASPISGIFIALCILLFMAVLTRETIRQGLGSRLWKASLLAISFSVCAALYLRYPLLIIVALFFNLLAFSALCFAFLANSLSWALFFTLFNKNINLFKKGHWLLVILASTQIAFLVGGIPSEKFIISPDIFNLAKLLSGGLAGLYLESICFSIVRFYRSDSPIVSFFRNGAIAIGSWRGTSFYGLDLSGVNFQGSHLGNTDLRQTKLYRTCFLDVTGLELARVDRSYLDLDNPKVQTLLTTGCSGDRNFHRLNLQGAYLQKKDLDLRDCDFSETLLTGADLQETDLRNSHFMNAQLAGANLQKTDLRDANLIDANLTGADCHGADLRGAYLVRSQVARVNFAGADLTGICIEDWSTSSKTNFENVRCDYVFKKYEDGKFIQKYPANRNFKPGEFAALFQQPENVWEVVFEGEFDYTALSLAFYKLQGDEPDFNLELKGIEQRGNLWVVTVTSRNPGIEQLIEEFWNPITRATAQSSFVETRIKQMERDYQTTTDRLNNDPPMRQLFGQLVRELAGIGKSSAQTAEAIRQIAQKQPFGTNFYILGGSINNLTGQGTIEYTEADSQIRQLITGGKNTSQIGYNLLTELRERQVATTIDLQSELIREVLISEAQRDPVFKQSLIQQQQQILATLPDGALTQAIQDAINRLA